MRINYLIAAMVTLLLIGGFSQSCSSSKKSAKSTYSRADELNDRLKEFNSAGWEIHGTTRTLKGKMHEHYEAMDS